MKKKLLAAVLVGTTLSLAACGGKAESTSEEKQVTAEMKSGSQKVEKEQKEDSEQGVFSQVNLSGFGNVGNNPNNIRKRSNLNGMAFDETAIYFSTGDGLYQADHSGEHVKMLTDDIADCLNRYKNELYYVQFGGYGRKYDLESGVAEDFLVQEEMEDLHRSSKTYKGFRRVDNFFIVDDYLFFTEAEGYEGTSELGSSQTSVVDLRDLTEYSGIQESANVMFTTDGEYVYDISGDITKIALAEIPNGAKAEEMKRIKCEYDYSQIIGSDGFYCVDDEDDTDKYYVYRLNDLVEPNNIYGKREAVLDIAELGGNGYDIPDGDNFIIGNTFFNFVNNRTLNYFKDMDFTNKGVIEGFSYSEAIGIYGDKLYIVDYEGENMRLTTVDAEGNYTQTAMIPEAVEE